jgi:hypothetical protein
MLVVITNSMKQNISWETKSRSASQEIPSLLWNPKLDYRAHKSPPLDHILSQMNPATPSKPVSLISILLVIIIMFENSYHPVNFSERWTLEYKKKKKKICKQFCMEVKCGLLHWGHNISNKCLKAKCSGRIFIPKTDGVSNLGQCIPIHFAIHTDHLVLLE